MWMAHVDVICGERPVAAMCVSCRWSLTRRRVTSRPHRKPSLQIKCTGASTRRRKRFMALPPPSPSSRSSFLHLGWRALLSRLTAERSCSTSSASAPPQLQRPIRRSPGTFVRGRERVWGDGDGGLSVMGAVMSLDTRRTRHESACRLLLKAEHKIPLLG